MCVTFPSVIGIYKKLCCSLILLFKDEKMINEHSLIMLIYNIDECSDKIKTICKLMCKYKIIF